MKEIEFNPTKHTLATSADVFRIYRELWGFAPIERKSHGNGSNNSEVGGGSPDSNVSGVEGVTMNYTRAEAIEMRKQEIQNEIDALTQARDSLSYESETWISLDAKIDNLLAEKDAVTAGALPAQLFRSESDGWKPELSEAEKENINKISAERDADFEKRVAEVRSKNIGWNFNAWAREVNSGEPYRPASGGDEEIPF